MKHILCLLSFFSASYAAADFQPFDREVTCISKNDFAELRIGYDKSEYPNFGWQGGIHVEIKTGVNSSLEGFVVKAGLSTEGEKKVLRQAGPAGQVGNWIQQDTKEPIVSHVKLGFGSYDLIGKGGEVVGKANSFISDLTISKVKRNGFSQGSALKEQEFYLVEILNDFMHGYLRFELNECVAAK